MDVKDYFGPDNPATGEKLVDPSTVTPSLDQSTIDGQWRQWITAEVKQLKSRIAMIEDTTVKKRPICCDKHNMTGNFEGECAFLPEQLWP